MKIIDIFVIMDGTSVNLCQLLSLRSRYAYAYYTRFLKRQVKKRRFWVREVVQERDGKGEFSLLVNQIEQRDHEYFRKCFKMSPQKFTELYNLVAPDIVKKSTNMREAISAKQRLAVTLRYLTTGNAHSTIAASYRMSPTTVGRIIFETCQAIWNRL